jgi:hypothetical protein
VVKVLDKHILDEVQVVNPQNRFAREEPTVDVRVTKPLVVRLEVLVSVDTTQEEVLSCGHEDLEEKRRLGIGRGAEMYRC